MAREAAKGYWGLAARRCDSCKGSPAVLFCRADAAYLCGTCDGRVHGANRLASRHERVWMCEVCEQAPAAVTCKADAATLCVTCDADIHAANPLARRHERFSVVPFFEPLSSAVRPSAAAAAATWMIPNPAPGADQKTMMEAPDLNFFADVDPYLDMDYADSLVPVQGKPVVAGGGAPPPAMIASDGVVEIDFALGKPSCSSYNAHSLSHSVITELFTNFTLRSEKLTTDLDSCPQVSSSEVGVVPDGSGSGMGDVSNPSGRPGAANPTVAMDREARVMRYREKRKNRKFEKTIRYASRKAYAETRPRIKGRFAKRVEMDADVDRSYSSSVAAAIMVDNVYGVVPSF